VAENEQVDGVSSSDFSQHQVPPDGAALAAKARSRAGRPLTRFAPAPTGYLHLGHVLNAEYVWGIARALDGRLGKRRGCRGGDKG